MPLHTVAHVDDLADGDMKQVEAGETAVLLARIDGTYYATAAHCTHYGAPLADGALSGDRVVCPWHHACFNLRTGAQEEPPGRDALPRFDVGIDGTDVVVDLPEEPADRRIAPMVSRDETNTDVLVVLGGGAAGAYAAEATRTAGFTGRVVMISDTDFPPVDRPNLSKQYLSGEAPEEWIPLRGDDFYDEHDIEAITGRTVETVDARAKRLTFADGETMAYTTLILCTGGAPRDLDVPGADLGGIHTLRTLADSRAIRARAEGAKGAVVVGASFIGLEAAWSLREHEVDVTVVAPDDVPLGRVFGPDLGRRVQQIHEEHGVTFRLGTQVDHFEGDGEVATVHLSDATTVETDLVVVGIGVTPATSFLQGIDLADDGGVPVDETLLAAEGLYAAGDVARFPYWKTGADVRIEHWRLACQHGRLAGTNAAGTARPYRSIPFFWTAHFGTSIRYVGHAEGWDEILYDGDPAGGPVIAFYVKDGGVHAAAGIDRDRDMAAIEELMRRDLMPPADDLRAGDVDYPGRLKA